MYTYTNYYYICKENYILKHFEAIVKKITLEFMQLLVVCLAMMLEGL